MKSLSLTLVLLASAPTFASAQKALEKVEKQVQTLTQQMQGQDKIEVQVPWNVVDEREAHFWQMVTEAYDLLMANRQTERYNFLYEASRANSQVHPARITALQNWLQTENKRIYALGLSYGFYEKWKEKSQNISQAIKDLAAARPLVEVKSNARGVLLDNKTFLENLKQDLTAPAPVAPAPATVLVSEVSSTQPLEYALVVLVAFASLAIGFALPRRQKKIKTVTPAPVQAAAEELPPLPELPFEEEENFYANPVENISGVSIEEECRKILKESSHLLELAQVKVNLTNRSPFKTSVNANEESVKEALNWLHKGTIALANTAKSKAAHLDWKCKEQNGRVSLEFVLHGIEVDQKSLYQNAVLDGDGSACAHFGRTEVALSGHQPVVAYRIGSKKTTISLGLETFTARSLDH